MWSGPLALLLAWTLLVVCPAPSHGGGILHVFSPSLDGETVAVERPGIIHSRTLITVSESFIDYRIEQTFFNNNDCSLEGLFCLPLDSLDSTMQPELNINGAWADFSLVAASDFLPTLQDVTTSSKDPSLVGLAGKDMMVVRPVSIGARREKSFRVHFRRPVSGDKDFMELVVPMAGERYSLGPIAGFEIRVRFKMSRPVRALFSPSNHLQVVREAPHRCVALTQSQDRPVHEDFRLLATFSREETDLWLFANRTTGTKGAFMSLISPPLVDPKFKDPDKDVVFVVDRSGSMSRRDMELAERAVIMGIERLRPTERFNVLVIGTVVEGMKNRLVNATDENIMDATRFLQNAPKGGGTDLSNGILTAMDQLTSRKRPSVIILISDGRGTVGVTNVATMLDLLHKNNRAGARIFPLALGGPSDTALLDKIAESTRGHATQFTQTEDFNPFIRRFLDDISPPQLSDISLEFLDIWPEQMIPDPIVEMAGQESVVVVGGYDEKSPVKTRVRLRYRVKGRAKSLTRTFELPKTDNSRPYVSELWGMRRVAKLMEKERVKGSEPETTEHIRRLCDEFGFVSGDSGSSAIQRFGRIYRKFKTSFVPADVYSDKVKVVNGKVFRMDCGRWIDAAYRPSMMTRTVKFLSEDYFAMLAADPAVGAYFCLGPAVTVVLDAGPVEVVWEDLQPDQETEK